MSVELRLLAAGYTQEQVDSVMGTNTGETKDEVLHWLRGWLLQGGYPGYRKAVAKIDEVLK